jgi:hypothetical protein
LQKFVPQLKPKTEVTAYLAHCDGTLTAYNVCNGKLSQKGDFMLKFGVDKKDILFVPKDKKAKAVPLGVCTIQDIENWSCVQKNTGFTAYFWMKDGLYTTNSSGKQYAISRNGLVPVTHTEWLELPNTNK